jgi:hypothetical protein
MKIVAGLVIGLYVMLAIGIIFRLIFKLRSERNPPKDLKNPSLR